MRKFTQLMLWALAFCIGLPATAQTFKGERSDFRDETIYFAMTTRFYDGDPKNNVCCWDKQDVQISKNDPDWRGDFAGLIEKLDYIKALGFTAIWITPIVQNASGEDYHGYHAMDMSSVDLRYESRTEWGSAKDVKFQDLVNAVHDKEMKIVLDIVLQHTGNFGEVHLNHLFDRNQNIRNQASVPASLIVDTDRLSSNYFDQDGKTQYQERWKYFKQAQYEPNNYYHHYGTGWNWDLPNRWWGQIAGDCVDLNTENDFVAEYVREAYGAFIRMGVDGFRIDTAGHIAPMTFNRNFIPRFHEIAAEAESVKNRRNNNPFFMFGEVCQRFQGSVVYRDQPNLSSYFYTWKSPENLLSQWNGTKEWWAAQVLNEGHDTPVGPMALCEKDTADKPRSNNALMQNGAWHEPDYSQSSGFSVIDFPVHYSFSNVGNTMGLYSQDNYYNDATYNVVYVDSHDYCPGPNDGTRFNGGTAQWAENLSWMFTFRGIPCIYYGSEVEFKKGLPIDVGGENNKTPRSQSGRAYFGNYIEGDIHTTDFGEFTATGNAAKTLNADLAHHITRLNQIRAAVPALRKGQYTFEGCNANGGWAFKRAYKTESYALVTVNGGGSFSNIPNGTYTEIVTGTEYPVSNGTLTLDAPKGQGQLRVAVLNWTDAKNRKQIGTDGKFMYKTSPVAHGGSVTFDDPGTPDYYTAEDAVKPASVSFSPAGGAFKTETLTVTATLSDDAVSGWYKIGSNAQVNLTKGSTKTFVIGQGMSYGESVTVTWGAQSATGENNTGKATYRKVDPNAVITVYVDAPNGGNMYAWDENKVEPCGAWPGKSIKSMESTDINGTTYYYMTFDDCESVNIIFNNNGQQTADITGITADKYYRYEGGSSATEIDVNVTPQPSMTFSPNGGNFTESVEVTATVKNATSGWYKINDGAAVTVNGTAKFTLGDAYSYDTPITVSWSASNGSETKTGSVKFTRKKQGSVDPDVVVINGDYNLAYSGDKVNVHYWGGSSQSTWPGVQMATVTGSDGKSYKVAKVASGTTGCLFNTNGDQNKTGDLKYTSEYVMNDNGATTVKVKFEGQGGDDPIPPVPPVSDGFWVFFDNSAANWTTPHIHYWGGESQSNWPGVAMTLVDAAKKVWGYQVAKGTTGCLFNAGDGDNTKTGDFAAEANGLYDQNGKKGTFAGVDAIEADGRDAVEYFNLQGLRVDAPTQGVYIRRQGNKVEKIVIR